MYPSAESMTDGSVDVQVAGFGEVVAPVSHTSVSDATHADQLAPALIAGFGSPVALLEPDAASVQEVCKQIMYRLHHATDGIDPLDLIQE